MNSRRVLPALALLLVLAGCGPFGGQSASENAEPGDPKPGTYVNDQYRYSLNAPGPMTSTSKATATYFGPEERLEVVAVEGASAADPAALADKDISGLKASIPDLKVVSGPAPVTLGDRRVIKVMYTGTVDNPTTGKPIKLTSARYYIPKNKALLAVVTFGDKSEEFDPKEADGIAKSFRWL